MATEHRALNRQDLARELAGSIAEDLQVAIAERGAASLVVSGGSTPRPLFEELHRQPLAWDQVWVTLADERWVPVDDQASNEALVRDTLRTEAAAQARWVGLKNDAPTPEAGRDACEAALAAIPRPYDVVVLGMGGDGHTASLFPDAEALAAGLDLKSSQTCLAVHPPAAPHARMSLTAAALLDSRRLLLHITGDEKWRVYQRVLEPGPAEELPIRALVRAAGPRFEVWWAP